MPSTARWFEIPWRHSPARIGDSHAPQLEKMAPLGVFAALWALATLFHVASYDNHWRLGALPVLAALWLLARPTSPSRLALLALAQLYVVVTHSPYISNHWLFTGFVNLTLLLAYGRQALAERTMAVDGETFYRTFAPAARLELLLLYFFAVLHKLNRDFYSTDTSCGASFYAAQVERFPFLPRSLLLEIASIHLTVLVEAAIPLLLLFRRTRIPGILLGAVFHGLIALNPESTFYNFSSMLYALFALFAPTHLIRAVAESPTLARWRSRFRSPDGRRDRYPALAVALLVGLSVVYLQTTLGRQWLDLALLLWGVYSLGWIALLIAALRWSRRAPADDPARLLALPWPGLAVVPMLVLLNGFAPYLGLKTETTFAMFSNLRTEGGETNHYLIPASWQIFDYQRDLVEIIDASNPLLRELARHGELMTLFELRSITSRRPEMTLAYRLHGQLVQVPRAGGDPLLSRPLSPLLRKLLFFRGVDKSGRQHCRH